MNNRRKPDRVNVGTDFNPEWREVREYVVDLGSGRRGNRRYKVLKHMLRDVISQRKKQLTFNDANTIHLWSKTSRFRIALKSPFVIYLEPDEWHALSRGLRALGTPAASTMYQWIQANKARTLVS